MGREVRKVPASWVHPKYERFNSIKQCYEQIYQPMFERSFSEEMDNWYSEWKKWESGFRPEGSEDCPTYWEWAGGPPDPKYYMPTWSDEEKTHFMMYEDTSEGTPISPAFETPEELARWLADNGASSFAGQTATYEGWLRVAKGGFAISAVVCNGQVVNGVDALTN